MRREDWTVSASRAQLSEAAMAKATEILNDTESCGQDAPASVLEAAGCLPLPCPERKNDADSYFTWVRMLGMAEENARFTLDHDDFVYFFGEGAE